MLNGLPRQGGHIARLSATIESCNEAEKPQEEASDVGQ